METDTNELHVEADISDASPLFEPCDHAERLETAHEAVIAILGNTHRSDSGLMNVIRSEMSRGSN